MTDHLASEKAEEHLLGPHAGIEDEEDVEGGHDNRAIDSKHALATHIVMPGSAIFLLSIIIGHALAHTRWTSWVPESASALATALIFGLFLHQLVANGVITIQMFTLVNSTVLSLFLLPIIIFQSGWSLRRSDFMSQFEYILIFAIFGTLISTLFIGYTSWGIGRYLGWHRLTGMRENFVFAALISAVDPVATLATYTHLEVDPLLNIMLFGESIINDAVAIVFFNFINEGWEDLHVLHATLRVAWLLFGSMFFGLVLAAMLIVLLRFLHTPGEEGQSYAEILFIWSSAFFIFAAAESCHLTGIIANLFAGILFGLYGRKNLSEAGQKLTDEYLGLCAFAADSAVFILCGASVAMLQSWKGFIFGMIAVVLCLLGRLAAVAPLGAIVNGMKKYQGEDSTVLGFKHLVMMWHGGLRGGIALMLALEIDGGWCTHKAIIVNGTFTVICVLLLFLGGSTAPMLGYMGVDMGVRHGHPDGSLVVPDKWYVSMFSGLNTACQQVLVGLTSKHDGAEHQNP